MRLTTPPDDQDRFGRRLPCGCDPRELAESLGLPVDELLRSIDAGEVVTVGLDTLFGGGARCSGPGAPRPPVN